MKKSSIALYLFLCFLVGFLLVIGQRYYTEKTKVDIEQETHINIPSNEINSLQKFVSLITFADNSTLDSPQDFTYVDRFTGRDNLHVQSFSPSDFYGNNRGNQSALRKTAESFSTKIRLYGTQISYKEEDLPPILQQHNTLHTWDEDGTNSFATLKQSLEKKLQKASISPKEMVTLSYTYGLEGAYKKAERIEERNCRRNKERCRMDANVTISGIVNDQAGNPVEDASVYILNFPDRKPLMTNQEGVFKETISVRSHQKIRLRAVKHGYAGGYNDFYSMGTGESVKTGLNFVINKAHGMAMLDNIKKTIKIVDPGTELASVQYENRFFEVQTSLTNYKIPINAIVKKSGAPFRGRVSLFIYEFDKSSNVDNLLRVDAQDRAEVRMFIGSILKTFGMPYFQLFDAETEEELFIDKSNPALLKFQIAEMEALKTGSDKIYAPLTTEDMKKLVYDSEKGPEKYPISRQYLIDNDLVKFPVWWILDRQRGMWNSVPVRVLDIKGIVETVFYSIDQES